MDWRAKKKLLVFPSEAELCRVFLARGVDAAWTAYPETGGWDLLLSRKADGFQIGIQAKLQLNFDVIDQCLTDRYNACAPGPDCRAVLVPYLASASRYERLLAYLNITLIRAYGRYGYDWRHTTFSPQLPRVDHEEPGWWCTLTLSRPMSDGPG